MARVVAADPAPGTSYSTPVLNPLTLRSESLVTTVTEWPSSARYFVIVDHRTAAVDGDGG